MKVRAHKGWVVCTLKGQGSDISLHGQGPNSYLLKGSQGVTLRNWIHPNITLVSQAYPSP